jgi:MFS family permease
MVVFLDAHGVAALFAARIVQGIATGAAVGVLGAYLLDLQPPDGSRLGTLVNSAAATSGLGIGAAATGVLVQYAPHPTRLVFVILSTAFVVLAAASLVLPETVTRRPGAAAAMRPQVAVPPAARRAFATAAPMMASSWMLGGLMLSVGGSLLAGVFATTNHAVIGAVLGLFAVAGALTVVALRELAPERMTRIGTVTLLVGVLAFVVALATTTLWLFVVSIAIAGAGFGPTFLGAFRTMSLLAAPNERAALISAIYVASYLAFSVPAVVAGLVLTRVDLRPTALVYAVVVSVVVAGTLALEARTSRSVAAAAE